jgi:hypothetical protein
MFTNESRQAKVNNTLYYNRNKKILKDSLKVLSSEMDPAEIRLI